MRYCLLIVLLLPLLAQAQDTTDQRFSQTLYLQPYSKLRQKAESGEAQAQYDLAYLYYKAESDPGISGIRQSYELAAEWYGKAARQGHVSAQYNMAVLHLHGHGVERDAIMAYAWLVKASEEGHKSSIELMKELDGILIPEQLERARQASLELVITEDAS